MTEIRQMNGAQVSQTNIYWSIHGNLASIHLPADANGNRHQLSYGYDAATLSFPVDVHDSLGYTSTSTFDPRFGVPLSTTDVSGNVIQYTYDDYGRLISVLAPYELYHGLPYTIRFSFWDDEHHYATESLVPYAITEHYDTLHPNQPITTVTFADGLGRALQTKKTATVYWNGSSADSMIVSGQVVYDGLGRTLQTFFPVTEANGSADTYQSNNALQWASETKYDALDRQLEVFMPDSTGTVSNAFAYGFATDHTSKLRFTDTVTDANSIQSVRFTDARGLQTQSEAAGIATTLFTYNALGELIKSIDPENDSTTYSYDLFGRVTQRTHPDAGTTTWQYDGAGNLLALQTANLAQNSQFIEYTYDYNQLVGITYPQNPENNVFYEYGYGGTGRGSGRVIRQQDASGVQHFSYGAMGEIIQNIHTFVLPQNHTYTLQMNFEYDSWNRIKTIAYPDGEVVTYGYDAAGQLFSMQGLKGQDAYGYIDDIQYDRYSSRKTIQYSNGTLANYTYDPTTLRLSGLRTYDNYNNQMQNLSYQYDDASNITSISNSAAALPNGLGGTYNYGYQYDSLYRLTAGGGSFIDVNNDTCSNLTIMGYSASGNITNKQVIADILIDGNVQSVNYQNAYTYNTPQQPHTLNNIENNTSFGWDFNGNMVSQNQRYLCWDEENRLGAVRDPGHLSLYLYNAGGERAWKFTGEVAQMTLSGKTQIDMAYLTNKTLYASSFFVANDLGYTKHYFAGSERVCSKLGGGMAPAPLSVTDTVVEPLYSEYPSIGDELFQLLQRFANCTPNELQVYLDYDPVLQSLTGDNLVRNEYEQERYFYHPDHLGSSSFISDAAGQGYQHLQYMPFGETFVSQKINTWSTPYQFSAKEKDEETGYSYFGARYYNSDVSVWLSVDPIIKPFESPYAYCFNNPVMYKDPNGMDPDPKSKFDRLVARFEKYGRSWRGKQLARYINRKSTDIDRYGAWYNNKTNSVGYYKKGEECSYSGKFVYENIKNYYSKNDFQIVFTAGRVQGGAGSWVQDAYNSPGGRFLIPDFMSIGVGFNAVCGVGAATSVELRWVTRGPEASWKPMVTVTQSIGGGFSIDATLNIEAANYFGDVNDIDRNMMLTNSLQGDIPSIWVSGGGVPFPAKIGATGYLTPNVGNSFLIGREINLGAGLPIGPIPVNVAGGISNTFKIRDFYE